MPGIDLGNTDNLLTIAMGYGLLVVAAFWLAMVVWTFRDMRARSRDGLARLLVAMLVGVLTLPGLLIYLFLRPKETLTEAYERSLEEEALLQEIEEKPTCPGCGQRVQDHWQVCPHCHTRLKRACIQCSHLLDLSWDLCPVCATPQTAYSTQEVDYSAPPAPQPRITVRHDQPQQTQTDALEFVDGEEYGVN